MLTTIISLLSLLPLPWGQEPPPAPDAGSIPEYTCAQVSGRPYTVEETELVEVRVLTPSGLSDASAGRARVEVHYLDLGTHYSIPALGFDRANVDVNSSIRVRAPLGRRLGVSAYSPERGYDEVVLEPIAKMVGEESAGVRVVTLTLPEIAEPGSFSFVRKWVEGARRGESPVHLSLRLPLTGARIAGSGSGREGAVHLKASVPPGEYLFCAEPFDWRFCGESPIQCPDIAGFVEIIRVRHGEETLLERPFEFGSEFKAHFTLQGVDEAQTAACDRDYQYLHEGDWWEAGANRHEAGRWHVSATAARLDPETGRYGRPFPMRWKPDTHNPLMEWTIAPVENWVASSCAYAPGQYRVTVEGPLVQDATFELVIDEKHRRSPAAEWTLVPR